MEGAAAKTGKLDPKMHELIALAVAVTTRCDGCIAVHSKKAVELGATREEIARERAVLEERERETKLVVESFGDLLASLLLK